MYRVYIIISCALVWIGRIKVVFRRSRNKKECHAPSSDMALPSFRINYTTAFFLYSLTHFFTNDDREEVIIYDIVTHILYTVFVV